MAKFFKCYNCLDPKRQVPGFDFTADKPVCPNCGLDAADPIVAHKIVQRRLIHFEPPHPIASDCGTGKIACGFKGGAPQVSRSILATNCPNCLASDAGKKAQAAAEATDDDVPNPADFVLGVDGDKLAKAGG